MPIYDPNHVEYAINSGFIQIVMDKGRQQPAYYAAPRLGRLFPAVALIHDWWGLTPIIRRLANHFAQTGYYVIVPDLFEGQRADSPRRAMELVEALGEERGMMRVSSALNVVEHHNHSNGQVACIGIGLGGSFAFNAAINRDDLEASVAFGGFPQAYLGRFKNCNTPILALYGSEEPHIQPKTIEKLKRELAESMLGDQHEVSVIDGIGHTFFAEDLSEDERNQGRLALGKTMDFLQTHLKGPIVKK